jgi:hypothetical protein
LKTKKQCQQSYVNSTICNNVNQPESLS